VHTDSLLCHLLSLSQHPAPIPGAPPSTRNARQGGGAFAFAFAVAVAFAVVFAFLVVIPEGDLLLVRWTLSNREGTMPTPQNYKNHTRLYPPYHFFLVWVFLINLIITIVVLIRRWPHHVWMHSWMVVMAIALFVLVTVARTFPLGVQDRVIRLEENLRYQRLLPPELLAQSQSLTLRQIIALRFASDAELPSLVQRTVSENLQPKAIKQAITNWRADNLRI